MSKKYTFTMVVVKPTGKGGKPLKPKPIKPKPKQKKLGGEMLKNPKKADLDKDGKLSGYEKKRGMAIEKNMKPKKANIGMLIMKKAKDKGAKGIELLSPLAMIKKATKKEGGMMAKKMGGGMMKSYNKGGGADTGKMGEAKSKLSSAIRKLGKRIMSAPKRPPMNPAKKAMGGEMKRGYGAARTSGMGLQDENLVPGKTMDYYKDLM